MNILITIKLKERKITMLEFAAGIAVGILLVVGVAIFIIKVVFNIHSRDFDRW